MIDIFQFSVRIRILFISLVNKVDLFLIKLVRFESLVA